MSENYWDRIADLWRLFGPPIRPVSDDLVVYQEIVDRATASIDLPPRVLLLGVTPELYRLRWPSNAEVFALDSSAPMIEAVWPGPADTAVTGSWTAMPFSDQSFTLLLCDAGVGLLDHPEGQKQLLAEAHRVLVLGGAFAVRLFAPQGRTGTVAETFEDLDRGRVATLDALKLRMWGALQQNPVEGVRPSEVARRILEERGPWQRLAQTHGWQPDYVRALELQLDSQASFHLVDANELNRMGLDAGLVPAGVHHPEHDYGDSCPVVEFRRPLQP